MSYKELLLERIENKTVKLAIIGVGYVGLPLAVEFAQVGYDVIGYDVSDEKMQRLNQGDSYIEDIPNDVLKPLIDAGKIRGTTNIEDLREADAFSICVPTPLTKTKDPDMSYILQAIATIAEVSHAGMIVTLESSTYPGTTTEIIRPKLEEKGWVIGEDIFVAFSPERTDPGNKTYGVHNTPKVIGGVTPACSEVITTLYSKAIETIVPVSAPESAEMVKLLENTFRSVNIGLVNEMAIICDKLGIDVWEVIQAASTKPFGFMPFYPGPGVGGHCIPIDPHYLAWKVKQLDYTARFIELASEVNTHMPMHVVNKVMDTLNDEAKALRGSRIVILGVAYKPNIHDVRESPALHIIELLHEKGGQVVYHDPHVPYLKLENGYIMESEAYNEQLLAESDCVVIVTNHASYDWAHVVEHSPVIVDTRNVTSNVDTGKTIVSI